MTTRCTLCGGSGDDPNTPSGYVPKHCERCRGSGREPQRLLALDRPHMQGDDVRQIQARLFSIGAPLVVDGIYGPATAAAVMRFQIFACIEADGIVGPDTRRALRHAE